MNFDINISSIGRKGDGGEDQRVRFQHKTPEVKQNEKTSKRAGVPGAAAPRFMSLESEFSHIHDLPGA